MESMRKRITVFASISILALCLVMESSGSLSRADAFHESDSFHSYSGGWVQRFLDGKNEGHHWTRYSINAQGGSISVYASIEIGDYPAELKDVINQAYVESAYKVGPYAPHKHGADLVR